MTLLRKRYRLRDRFEFARSNNREQSGTWASNAIPLHPDTSPEAIRIAQRLEVRVHHAALLAVGHTPTLDRLSHLCALPEDIVRRRAAELGLAVIAAKRIEKSQRELEIERILAVVRKYPNLVRNQIAVRAGVKSGTCAGHLKKLKQEGVLRRVKEVREGCRGASKTLLVWVVAEKGKAR